MKLVSTGRITGALLLAAALGGAARAADAVAEIEAHDKAFLAAYEKGETAKMKSAIGKAVATGEKNHVGDKPAGAGVMADTYVLAAILEVDGNENHAAGVKDFVKALKLKPDVAIPQGMSTSSVKAALKEARLQIGVAPKETPTKDVVAGAPAPGAAAAGEAKDDAKQKALAEQQAREATARAAQAEQEKKAEQDKKDKADRELGDAKTRANQLEKDKAASDKALADANARAAQLERDKADRDKQITDLKAKVAQLEKQRDEREKVLAEARAAGDKEREAREKVERERQEAAAKAQAADDKRKHDQQERERLLAGPELPAKLPEPLHCAIPDEAPARTDLYVHCAARANVKAKSIVFYYRAGGAHYTSVPLDRNGKGWFAAVIPGARLTGKALQYYIEAFDAKDNVAANNGKEASPNILPLRSTAPRG
ncbi:MAG TPA: hypothetical protein VHJ20_02715 [Polyangia bacterium]|nr:hypothetical protein [Polyangia bacterium]